MKSIIRGGLSSLGRAEKESQRQGTGDNRRTAEESIKGTERRKGVGGRGQGKKPDKLQSIQHEQNQKLQREGRKYQVVLSAKGSKINEASAADGDKTTGKLGGSERFPCSVQAEGPVDRICLGEGIGGEGCAPAKETHVPSHGKSIVDEERTRSGKGRALAQGLRTTVEGCWRPAGRSYKEVLLKPVSLCNPPSATFYLKQRKILSLPVRRGGDKRCFRCLAFDHWARECRDPIRCSRCHNTGHLGCDCRAQRRGAMHVAGWFRPQALKVFVPLSEGYYLRQLQCRRAVLATPMGTVNLGHYPQGTIANDLAGRFGGFSNDFLVAKYQERDFVIFLPQWVQPEVLIRREGVRLGLYRLRCFAWNPYRDAVRARLTYKV